MANILSENMWLLMHQFLVYEISHHKDQENFVLKDKAWRTNL